jgi:hypothetical protein
VEIQARVDYIKQNNAKDITATEIYTLHFETVRVTVIISVLNSTNISEEVTTMRTSPKLSLNVRVYVTIFCHKFYGMLKRLDSSLYH